MELVPNVFSRCKHTISLFDRPGDYSLIYSITPGETKMFGKGCNQARDGPALFTQTEPYGPLKTGPPLLRKARETRKASLTSLVNLAFFALRLSAGRSISSLARSQLFHRDDLYIKDQVRIARNGAATLRTIAEGRGDVEAANATSLHADQALIPALDHLALAKLERERLRRLRLPGLVWMGIIGAIKFLAGGRQPTGIIDGNRAALLSGWPTPGFNIYILQPILKCHHLARDCRGSGRARLRCGIVRVDRGHGGRARRDKAVLRHFRRSGVRYHPGSGIRVSGRGRSVLAGDQSLLGLVILKENTSGDAQGNKHASCHASGDNTIAFAAASQAPHALLLTLARTIDTLDRFGSML